MLFTEEQQQEIKELIENHFFLLLKRLQGEEFNPVTGYRYDHSREVEALAEWFRDYSDLLEYHKNQIEKEKENG